MIVANPDDPTSHETDAPERRPIGMRLELRPVRGAVVPPVVELRTLLKAMLRGWNFRCVELTPVYNDVPEAEGGSR
jgi:hypothetical protein